MSNIAVNGIEIAIQFNVAPMPATAFCDKVNTCLGISPQGTPTLFLNEQGDWVEVGGGTPEQILNTTLTGLDTNQLAIITEDDSILTAFGKLQAQTLLFFTDKPQAITVGIDSITDSDQPIDIDGLSFDLLPDSIYVVQAAINVTAGGGGMKVGTLVEDAVFAFGCTGKTNALSHFVWDSLTVSEQLTSVSFAISGSATILIDGTVETGELGGILQFIFASATDGQESTVLRLGTYLKIQRA